MNKKQTSKSIASLAATTLNDSHSSSIQRQLAGSALSQYRSSNQTGSKMEDIASRALSSSKYNDTTKRLAASILSQSNKIR